VQPLLQVRTVAHAEPLQQPDVLRAAAQEYVLAVINGGPGLLVGVRIRTTAEEWTLLD
jgi:hypothetical protein